MKIKRATTKGLREAEGELFEANGMQFCLVEADDLFFSIHLPTGCNVISAAPDEVTKSEAIELAKKEINRRTKSEWDYALNKVSDDYCSRFKFSLPVNEPVLNGL
jgi:hypothetical protein